MKGCGRSAISSAFPEHACDRERFDFGRSPPRDLAAMAVKLAVMQAAKRNRELIADLATERPRLRKAQMMRLGWQACADEAGLSRYKFPVKLIAQANVFGQGARPAF